MNDPWDVKSKRKSGQYVSCMKINGVPLLPPVLSKECREEMQYYKLLAREVNKRLTGLHSYIHDAGSSSDCEPGSIERIEHGQTHSPRSIEARPLTSVPSPTREKSLSNFVSSNSPVNDTSRSSPSPKVYIDVNVSFNKTLCNEVKIISPPPKDIPERDYNSHKSKKNTPKCQLNKNATQIETKKKGKKIENKDKNCIESSRMLQDRPSAHGIKSFTGSLNDLHSESIKDSEITSGSLVRQSSYTLLQPSPHLLAHLENQSLSTGVEMTSISMSESCSNINTFNKKRRSWDLESAKATWSNMALELSLKKNVSNVYGTIGNKNKNHNSRSYSCQRSQPIASSPSKNTISNPCNKFKPKVSPVKKNINLCLTKPSQPCVANDKTQPIHVSASENIDPALKIRELYEKVQKQQLVQMASLVEKQKKEQMLLQQVFEEQNKLLFKQLKTICPKSPIEIKEAWVDQEIEDRGPVSLSQVINYKSPGSNTLTSPQANYPLTDVYLDRRNNGTNKSEEKIESLKKQQIRTNNQNTNKRINDRTCTSSPVTRTSLASRKLNYDTSDSTDREYEPILTDRTNDTMADLNVTFPSDHSDEYNASVIQSKRPLNQQCAKDNGKQNGGSYHSTSNSRVTETPTHNTARFPYKTTRTPRELEAATKIVAHVKGYLVRRLMRTDRVQGIVQTIKDALLCALQLHQDREGIRGADVDLHRRLIQQITAACYSLHDTFVASSPAERCAMISADRDKRRRSVSSRQSNNSFRQTDIMSQSHSGSFPARAKRQQPSLMTQSNYETFSNGDKSSPVSRRYMSSPRRRPWR